MAIPMLRSAQVIHEGRDDEPTGWTVRSSDCQGAKNIHEKPFFLLRENADLPAHEGEPDPATSRIEKTNANLNPLADLGHAMQGEARIRGMNEAVNALGDLDERAIVGEDTNDAVNDAPNGVPDLRGMPDVGVESGRGGN